jgi:hypothetical protein
MNNQKLAEEIAKRLVNDTWLLGVSYGFPYFDGLNDLQEQLLKILSEVNPETVVDEGMQK